MCKHVSGLSKKTTDPKVLFTEEHQKAKSDVADALAELKELQEATRGKY